ncbi:MAG: DnaJ domain-containing protein [Deltaproteobacteria bacterium]|nr:DnaJ domain-containing protein [Deltaproteobacteria bacterium]
MDYTQPQFWPQLQQLAATIDGLDYFQVLNLPNTAAGNQIRDSYYGLSRALHPDKFFHITDEVTKAAVHKIYKRVTEAYTILKDEKKRIKYLADISGPDRAKKLRFTEESETEQKEQAKQATKVAKTPKGEQLYQAALLDMKKSQWDKAYKGIQTAAMLEPSNSELKALLADLDKKRKGG